MTPARKNYIARANFVKKITIVRNICAILSFLCFVATIGEYTGRHYMLFYNIGLVLILVFTGLVVGIEYFVLNVAIFDGDIDFKPIFGWNIDFPFISYNEFLKENELEDTDKNYSEYRKVTKKCI